MSKTRTKSKTWKRQSGTQQREIRRGRDTMLHQSKALHIAVDKDNAPIKTLNGGFTFVVQRGQGSTYRRPLPKFLQRQLDA